MIQAASSGIGGGDLPHAERDHQREKSAYQPTDEGTSPACGIEGGVERRDTTSQNTNDRERDCKVGEAAHPAGKLLGISHLVQDLLIVFMHFIGHFYISFMKLKKIGAGKSGSLALCHRP